MTQKSLYYDINDGVLGFQDENGYIIPVKTSATLYPGQIKIENGNLWIKTEFSEDGWEPVTDTSGKPAKFPDELEIARQLNEKQDKLDNSLETMNKTIVAAINELKHGIDYVSYSATYPKGSNEIKRKLYKTLMPGTYKITASVECSPKGTDPFTGACFCLGPFSSPHSDVECVKSFGDLFTITEATDIYLLYADFAYAKACAETDFTTLGAECKLDVTVTVINPLIITLNSTQLISIENDKLVLKTKNAYNQVTSTEEINVVGKTGASCSASLDDNGDLQITNISSDGVIEVITKNIKGQNGADGKDGADGQDGKDGITPYISTSGTWMIGNQDTGIQAKGQDGIDGKDAPLPQLQIVDGSIQYKLSDASDWSTLITNKEIFVEPDIRNSLPENPTDEQIITWERNPDLDHNFKPGKKYQYLAAGRIIKEMKLLGKAPNSESYTVFNLVSTEAIPSFSLESIKKEILTSNDRIITPAGTYCKMSLTEGLTSLQSLQPIYDDGAKTISSITGSDAVRTLIDTNPSETHWAVAEIEEVLLSGKWIQIL